MCEFHGSSEMTILKDDPCHCKRGTLKNLYYSMAKGVKYRSKFETLQRLWWRRYLSEKILEWDKKTKQTYKSICLNNLVNLLVSVGVISSHIYISLDLNDMLSFLLGLFFSCLYFFMCLLSAVVITPIINRKFNLWEIHSRCGTLKNSHYSMVMCNHLLGRKPWINRLLCYNWLIIVWLT